MRDPLFSLDGKRVLLTGAGGAIGGVLAWAMAARGAVVGLQDISPDKIEPLQSRITDEGGSAVSIVADLAEALPNARFLLPRQGAARRWGAPAQMQRNLRLISYKSDEPDVFSRPPPFWAFGGGFSIVSCHFSVTMNRSTPAFAAIATASP